MAGRPKRRTDIAKLETFGIEQVASWIADGMTVKACSEKAGVSYGGLHAWLTSEAHRETYARARGLRAAKLAEEALEISDTATVQDERVARLRVDTRKWFAARLDPVSFGDRLQQDVRIQDVAQLHVSQLRGLLQRGITVDAEHNGTLVKGRADQEGEPPEDEGE